MAEEVPVSEVRRVVIEYEIRVPSGGAARPSPAPTQTEPDIQDLAEKIRRELLRVGSRNLNVGLS